MSLPSPALQQAVRHWHRSDLNGVLYQAARQVEAIKAASLPDLVPGGCPEMDHLLQAIAPGLLPPDLAARPLSGTWTLATAIYELGGHTAVAADLARACGGIDGLLVTRHQHQPITIPESVWERAGATRRVLLYGHDSRDQLRQAFNAWSGGFPERLFLLHHPKDGLAVLLAAMAAHLGSRVFLIHHCDWHPSLGLHLRNCRVVDLSPRAWSFTRHALGLDPIYLPVTCPDPGPPPVRTFCPDGRATLATSGSKHKFPQDTVPNLEDLVLHIAALGHRHLHIGPLPADRTAALLRRLADRGFPPDTFRHIPATADFQKTLRDEPIDLLLNSWPLGGLRTVVEAMAAGLPVAWHSPHPADDLWNRQLAYPGSPVWRGLHDLDALLARPDPGFFAEQSRRARTAFDTRHHPALWKAWLQDGHQPATPVFDPALHVRAIVLDTTRMTHAQLRADDSISRALHSGLRSTLARTLQVARQLVIAVFKKLGKQY